jgi:hypothetical protein
MSKQNIMNIQSDNNLYSNKNNIVKNKGQNDMNNLTIEKQTKSKGENINVP